MCRWAGGFVVPGSLGCTEGSDLEFVSCFGFGKNSSAVYLLFECFCWFAGIAFDAHHPSPLLHSCKWNNLVPHPHHSSVGAVALRDG